MGTYLANQIIFAIVICLAVFSMVLAISFWSFPANLAAVIIGLAVIIASVYLSSKSDKKAKLEIFYLTANEFGKPISLENNFASFERQETIFNAEFPTDDEHNDSFIVSFFLSRIREIFFIHPEKAAANVPLDCNFIDYSPLRRDIFLYADNPEFVINLVQNPKIQEEIYEYADESDSSFQISFKNGYFEIKWTPNLSEYVNGFYRICRTAVIFCDEIKKLNSQSN